MKNYTEPGQIVFHVDIQDGELKTSVSGMMTRRGRIWSATVMANIMVHIAEMVDMSPDDFHKLVGESMNSGLPAGTGPTDAMEFPMPNGMPRLSVVLKKTN